MPRFAGDGGNGKMTLHTTYVFPEDLPHGTLITEMKMDSEFTLGVALQPRVAHIRGSKIAGVAIGNPGNGGDFK